MKKTFALIAVLSIALTCSAVTNPKPPVNPKCPNPIYCFPGDPFDPCPVIPLC